MHLLGQLSSPSPKLLRVLRLSKDHVKLGADGLRASPEPTQRRLGNEVVQRAVIEVLSAADGPMRTSDVQAGVERLLCRSGAIESVSWSLRTGPRGEKPRFERMAYWTYRLSQR
jgi:hypothetical protein